MVYLLLMVPYFVRNGKMSQMEASSTIAQKTFCSDWAILCGALCNVPLVMWLLARSETE